MTETGEVRAARPGWRRGSWVLGGLTFVTAAVVTSGALAFARSYSATRRHDDPTTLLERVGKAAAAGAAWAFVAFAVSSAVVAGVLLLNRRRKPTAPPE